MMVKKLLHSVSPQGIEVATFHCRYWRAIHSELMTHRDFGRNARSSRAVPSLTLLSEDIFVPQFGMNQRGMQSQMPADKDMQEFWETEWRELAEITRAYVERWQASGMHKQWANRPLEWFGWIDVQITATRWNNFWALRISPMAQPEFTALATAMKEAMEATKPVLLQPGEWHLPWITDIDRDRYDLETCKKLSVARSARLSYKPFDGSDSLAKELERYKLLVVSRPVHASPAEHQCTPDRQVDASYSKTKKAWRWSRPDLHGNLHGWVQYRKTLPNEVVL